MDYMSSASARFAHSGPLAPSLLCRPVCYRMWQPHVTVSQSLPARLHRPGTAHQRDSSLCFLTSCTSLTFGIFLGDLNNSHAGNSHPPLSFLFVMKAFIMEKHQIFLKWVTVHAGLRKGFSQQVDQQRKSWTWGRMSPLTLRSVCGLDLNTTLYSVLDILESFLRRFDLLSDQKSAGMMNIDGHSLTANLCIMLLLPLSFKLDPHLMKFFRL